MGHKWRIFTSHGVKSKFTPEAVDDLVRLREFIEEKNPIAAQRVAKEILNGIEKLRSFPEIGLKVLRGYCQLKGQSIKLMA